MFCVYCVTKKGLFQNTFLNKKRSFPYIGTLSVVSPILLFIIIFPYLVVLGNGCLNTISIRILQITLLKEKQTQTAAEVGTRFFLAALSQFAQSRYSQRKM